jgi:TetR/AcrR family transcriptional regulator, regulator of autoinduction and epiphytic fitness
MKPPRLSLKEQQLKVLEDATLDVVNRFLSERGYDAMTVDAVAAEVGIAKASLYKHFASKESLAVAAMIRLMDRALAAVQALPATMPPLDQLRATLRWALETRLDGALPLLPSASPALRASLFGNAEYLGRVQTLNERLLALIEQAQSAQTMSRAIPADVMLFSLYARTCDPSLDYLRIAGRHSDADLVNHLIAACFDGLVAST